MLRTGKSGTVGLLVLLWLGTPGAMAQSGPATDPGTESAPAQGESAAASGDAPKPADTPQVLEARTRIPRAEALFDAENYDAALAEFEKAYELLQGHRLQAELLYNIALCHERRFRYAVAMQLYSRYMQEAGSTGEARAEVEGTVRTLQNLLASVDVRSNVQAEVWVDENLVGTAPGRVLVPGGRHTLELRAKGHESQKREISIAARETRALDFTLTPLEKGLRPAWFYGTSGATVVTAVVGISFAAKLMSERNDYADKGPNAALNRPSDQDHLKSMALRADVFFATSGVLAITSAVLALFTDFRKPDEPAKTSARLLLSPTSVGFQERF
jgi:tetratricopeptide (TPR) repeat protein